MIAQPASKALQRRRVIAQCGLVATEFVVDLPAGDVVAPAVSLEHGGDDAIAMAGLVGARERVVSTGAETLHAP